MTLVNLSPIGKDNRSRGPSRLGQLQGVLIDKANGCFLCLERDTFSSFTVL
jgi:hypothetical protein